MSILYDRIHALCVSKNVKDGTMCREAGLPRSTLQELKMGRTESLSLKNLQKIADYFGISVSELTGEDQKEKPNALDGIELEKLSPARLALLEALEGMDDENIMKIVRIAQAVKKELPE